MVKNGNKCPLAGWSDRERRRAAPLRYKNTPASRTRTIECPRRRVFSLGVCSLPADHFPTVHCLSLGHPIQSQLRNKYRLLSGPKQILSLGIHKHAGNWLRYLIRVPLRWQPLLCSCQLPVNWNRLSAFHYVGVNTRRGMELGIIVTRSISAPIQDGSLRPVGSLRASYIILPGQQKQRLIIERPHKGHLRASFASRPTSASISLLKSACKQTSLYDRILKSRTEVFFLYWNSVLKAEFSTSCGPP